MKGRKKKPAALRLIEGNRGHRPIVPEPNPGESKPRCPTWLQGEYRKAFRFVCRQLEEMDILKAADTYAITAIAVAVGDLIENRKQFAEKGGRFADTDRQNPHSLVSHRCLALISKLSAQLALDPTARARLASPALPMKTLKQSLANDD